MSDPKLEEMIWAETPRERLGRVYTDEQIEAIREEVRDAERTRAEAAEARFREAEKLGSVKFTLALLSERQELVKEKLALEARLRTLCDEHVAIQDQTRDLYEARLREVEAERVQRGKCLYCDDTAKRRYPVCYNHRQQDVAKLEAEVKALREALVECHGTEPSVNFRDGKAYEYCPLCDDQTWPCKVTRLLTDLAALAGGER